MGQPGGESEARWLTRPGALAFAVFLLSALVYLPGLLALPPVDRTEVIWAESSRGMVERQAWLDPRYGERVDAFRPIGTFWAQGAARAAAGEGAARDIRIYRFPSLLAVSAAVLALFLLAAPRVGTRAALVAAGLFAVAPLTVLVGTLAIADGLALLPASVAMLALLRLYDPIAGQNDRVLAGLFWAAVGVGMLVNALHTPILILATLAALFALERDLSWLKRTRPLVGAPLALAIAAPWLAVRVLQDGIPFAGLDWKEFLAALGGAQDMKLRAFPGTFLAAALIGFLPGVAMLPPALIGLWQGRAERLPRFLLAWIAGYIAYLELLSSKPGTYTVQVMFPAMALAVAMLVCGPRSGEDRLRWSLVPWPPLAAGFAVVVLGAANVAMGAVPALTTAAAITVVALLFAWSAAAGRQQRLAAWAWRGVLSLAAFAVTLLGLVLPGIAPIWPAPRIAAAVEAACGRQASVGVYGFREPSAAFLFGSASEPPRDVTAVEARWLERYRQTGAPAGDDSRLGCVAAYNTMRGCSLHFVLFANPLANRCQPLPALACDPGALSSARRNASKACD